MNLSQFNHLLSILIIDADSAIVKLEKISGSGREIKFFCGLEYNFEMRIVVDTKVVVNAHKYGGASLSVVDAVIEGIHQAFTSEALDAEMTRVLASRIRNSGYLAFNLDDYLNRLTRVEQRDIRESVITDPDDVMLLGTALAANALIISLDRVFITFGPAIYNTFGIVCRTPDNFNSR